MKILLAVSGGIDSMYMANRAPELFPGACFAVAHCNFGLRGEESDGDEAFVREWCGKRDMECFARRFDTAEYASGKGISIEMAARELRYAWFAELCSGHGFEAVAVAHNLNDNAETAILNMLRGTGPRGMRGMSKSSRYSSGGTVTEIRRPLLDVSREEITDWMTVNKCGWREDRTNADCDYKRNRIRNRVFPLFREINPSFLRTLNRNSEHFALADDIAEDYFRSSGLDMEKGVDIRELLALKHWKYVLFRLTEPYGLSEETFGKLTELLESDRTISGKAFQSPTHVLHIRKKTLSAEKRF